MFKINSVLPIKDISRNIDEALIQYNKIVIVAPPGAGKTTFLPLYLLEKSKLKHGNTRLDTPIKTLVDMQAETKPENKTKKNKSADYADLGKIILLEPRRLAARAAASRMAAMLGEEVGETIGYQMRLDRKISDKSKIIVVTEGVFARMVLDDPELSGIDMVLFDEFHERSLDADFSLALALDVQQALREDLRIFIMSATLDGARIGQLLDNAPIIESKGRTFPVDIIYQARKPLQKIEACMAATIIDYLNKEQGSILAFLPGQKEILATQALLEAKIPNNLRQNMMICPLYGAMDAAQQDAAISKPQGSMRKIVLATSIAESSLTIEDVRIVIDSTLARVPIYEAATNMTRLATVKASKASLRQRAGRAGRNSHGIAVRLMHERQFAALNDYETPEILSADLSNMLLDCADFGVHALKDLTLLDMPPKHHIEEAKKLLVRLGGLDIDGRITKFGKAMQKQALPVRLAAMMLKAENAEEKVLAAEIAVLLTERGLGGFELDLEKRLDNFRKSHSERSEKARILVKKLSGKKIGKPYIYGDYAIGRLLLHAFPDRLAKSRGQNGRFLLSNGRGAEIEENSALAKALFLLVADMTGSAEYGRILAAAEIDAASLQCHVQDKIEITTKLEFDSLGKTFQSREKHMFGRLVLSEKNAPLPKGDVANNAMLDAIARHGLEILPFDKKTLALRQKLSWLHRHYQADWPNLNDAYLLEHLQDWLLPFLHGEAKLETILPQDLYNGILSLVSYDMQQKIDIYAPNYYIVPTGSQILINYAEEEPMISVKVQELYGLDYHPSIGDAKSSQGQIPLVLELLSPAQRPIQITKDLIGFWQGSWMDLRADMRGRYPKHEWPENPLYAVPTKRAKRRK